MNYAAADLHLAIAHHLLIFLLAGILAFEIGGRVGSWRGPGFE
jgi:hypothetical protein